MGGLRGLSLVSVYLSLGSNLGNRKRYIKEAIALLRNSAAFKIERVSSFLETEPEGVKNQPEFINVCLKGKTRLKPEELLALVKGIEKKLGRKKRRRWGPREIDIDILFFGKMVLRQKNLIIPHPRLERRLFVLKPLAEISPMLRHPVSGMTISRLNFQFSKNLCIFLSLLNAINRGIINCHGNYSR